jgi:orotidine-5'-phosphate decarboxylase
MQLFRASRGLIPACDMADLADVSRLVKATADLPFVQGYKIGMTPGLGYGLKRVVQVIRRHTELPVIYDHQKFGTDVPELCAGQIIEVFQQAGLQGVIVFPLAGARTLEASVRALDDAGIISIIGGEMTHPGYLQSENGYIADESPSQMYTDAATLGVDHFVVPGTRLRSMAHYKDRLSQLVSEPKFLFPGIGRGQGGDIVEAFRQVAPFPSYAIVGRGLSGERDRTSAAQRLWHAVEAAGLGSP